MPPISVSDALAVFADAYARKRSLSYPAVTTTVDSLLVVRDAERKNGKYRNEEWVAVGTEPLAVDATVRAHTRGKYALCVVVSGEEDETAARAAYKGMGYRLGGTEPLMVHDLSRIPRPKPIATIERVLSREDNAKLVRFTGRKMLLPEDLDEVATRRHYVARVDGAIVGAVASYESLGATYCDSMFVAESHRRRGIATALMARLLRDDRARGSRASVLLASHTGALLYPNLGYRQIGTVLLFTPPRS